ncbi:substrate-binding domain-containing protein [Roseiconus lacunae]|uniref:Helix-turn-helix domain-containing protein n=1 Tax=Roseiconus lacunae TaxID=2605694 RepID=A0ABT7PLZ5_9BACT|nr:substrate-binding domain-containing protein [Roseiconus lacunae]MCD0460822.1 helix-turn-helix domain-containing protein [Roseiconus lacunae]MDM4017176.1 helix-turn-helix domain-containing protein [Roseiconus lacunae]
MSMITSPTLPSPGKSWFKPPYRIAVLIQAANNFSRGIILGASAYSRQHGGWDFLYPATSINGLLFPKGEVPLPEGWHGEGILFRSTSDSLWQTIRDSGIPAVNVSWRGLQYDELISVVADPTRCGELAADYIASKQHEFFGYVGVPHWQGYTSELYDAIRRRLGADLITFEFPSQKDYQSCLRHRLSEWIKHLPKPIGIITWSTDQARILISICHSLGVSVPNEVSLVTCEYDELSAALSPIPISGVYQNPQGVGFEAARMLEGVISGQQATHSNQLVPPIDVIERESSNVVAFYDEFLQQCLKLIDHHLASGINATKLASEMDVSRRTLEMKFSKFTDKTPSAVIDESKIRVAKQLLCDTDLFLEDIAKRTGFSSTSAFTRFFKRNLGCSPSTYRNSHAFGDASW